MAEIIENNIDNIRRQVCREVHKEVLDKTFQNQFVDSFQKA